MNGVPFTNYFRLFNKATLKIALYMLLKLPILRTLPSH